MQQASNISHTKLTKVLGEIIKKHRKIRGETIYKISAEIAMSKSTWRDVEQGCSKDVKLSTLWKIAEGLDIPLGELINELNDELGDDFTLSGLD